VYHNVDDIVRDVRRLDGRSDELLRALVARAPRDERAACMVIVALLPLALARCNGGRAQIDELIGELAIVIGEVATDGLRPSSRRLANRLLDRAWGQVRRPTRRIRRPLVCDPADLESRVVDRRADPAEAAAQRVDLERTVRWLSLAGPAYGATARAWDTAVSLAEAVERTPSDRARLKYARRVLRRSPVAHLVA
jgi:hypothetical protein